MKIVLASTLLATSLCINAQTITTVAGGGFSGLGDGGIATSAQLSNCHGLDFDAAGNMYIADGNNARIRKVAAGTGIITTYAGNGTMDFSGDGGLATAAEINSPWDVALDAAGNLYIADAANHRIRKVDATTGIITTVAGTTNTMGPIGGYNGDGIPANTAELYHPNGIAVDASGNIYIAEFYNNRVRKITASTGIISTIAGTGSNAYNGDGILATTAAVFGPNGVAVDASGNVYISENQNQRVRKITASTGMISTIAGNGAYGYSGDGGLATAAQVVPNAIVLDAAGNIYVAHNSNSCRIRKIDAATGIITTIAGDGSIGFTGDGGNPLLAQFNGPSGLAFDASGNLYIGDAINNRVRKIGTTMITTGIPFNYSDLQSSLYPNPFNSRAILSFPEEQHNSTLTITDAQGKVLRNKTFNGNSVVIEKEELAPGIYFVTVLSTQGKTMSRKFVVE